MSEKHETTADIIAEMRGFKRYAASDSSDCRYVAYWLYQTFADRFEAALRRDCMSIERIVRDAILSYGEMFRIAPNDESEAELKAMAEMANAWLERHGFTREEITWTKEEASEL